jgi:transposase
MQDFISVGIDVGSKEHRIAVMSPNGQILAEWSVRHRHADFKQAYQRMQSLAQQHKLPLMVGIEGYNGYASPFDQCLIAQGIKVKQINNLTLNRYRMLFGQPYKTDDYDARLIASYLQQPYELKSTAYQENQVEKASEQSTDIKLISRHQRDLIKEQTQTKNRLHKLLLSYFPEIFDLYEDPFSANCLALIAQGKTPAQLKVMSLKRLAAMKPKGGQRGLGPKRACALKRLLQDHPALGNAVRIKAMIAANYAKRINALEHEIHQLDQELANMLTRHPSGEVLQSVPGIATKTASRIIGETMNISRFATLDKYCAYAGVVCLRNDSGCTKRAKASKNFNRLLKDTYMKIALSSLRVNPVSAAYYRRKRKEGHEHFSALKCLAHQICKVVYKLMSSNAEYQQFYKKAA